MPVIELSRCTVYIWSTFNKVCEFISEMYSFTFIV